MNTKMQNYLLSAKIFLQKVFAKKIIYMRLTTNSLAPLPENINVFVRWLCYITNLDVSMEFEMYLENCEGLEEVVIS